MFVTDLSFNTMFWKLLYSGNVCRCLSTLRSLALIIQELIPFMKLKSLFCKSKTDHLRRGIMQHSTSVSKLQLLWMPEIANFWFKNSLTAVCLMQSQWVTFKGCFRQLPLDKWIPLVLGIIWRLGLGFRGGGLDWQMDPLYKGGPFGQGSNHPPTPDCFGAGFFLDFLNGAAPTGLSSAPLGSQWNTIMHHLGSK